MKPSALASALLPLLSNATAIKRAGAPASQPIPESCTVINPLPHATCGTANVSGYKPTPSFMQQNLLYQSYFNNSGSAEEQAQQCAQQCYGYGNAGECKSSFVAMNVPVPKGYFGSADGQLKTACLLFKEWLSPLDFEVVEVRTGRVREEFVGATAASIHFPLPMGG